MQSCMLQMTCSLPILFNDRKLNEHRHWLLYIHLLKGVLGANDILEIQMKRKRFLNGNNQQY